MVSKDLARANTSASRAARSDHDRQTCGHALSQHDWANLIHGDRVSLYVSMFTEPPTQELRKLLLSIGKTVALPIMSAHRALEWGLDSDTLTTNSFGVDEPVADDTLTPETFDTMIIPAQRAGLDGSRLGRGAGYYDRVLSTLRPAHEGGPLRVVIVYDDEVDETVPCDEWDQPVDVIVTPSRIIHVSK